MDNGSMYKDYFFKNKGCIVTISVFLNMFHLFILLIFISQMVFANNQHFEYAKCFRLISSFL